MIKARYRHLIRFREIGRILTQHSLNQLFELVTRHADIKRTNGGRILALAGRFRQALEQLGPTFIKLGQLLSTRPDLIPLPIILELEKLQDQVNPVPIRVISEILAAELGPDFSTLFSNIEEQPLASASIGQVHKATLLSGEKVVIKVQRPGIRKLVETDLEIFLDSARLFQRKTKWGAFYRLAEIAEEFSNSVLEELDYTFEGRNCEKLRELCAQDKTVYVPKVFWEYSTPRILTMEYVEGIKVNNLSELYQAGLDKSRVARNLVNSIFRQIFIYGLFHADPHPGNLAVRADHSIIYMDFGLVGRISEDLREKLVSLSLAIVRQDVMGMSQILIDISDVADTVNPVRLGRDLERLMVKYYDLPIDQLNLGEVLREMLKMAYVYQIRVPSEVILLAKSLVTMEGVVTQLDAQVSVVDLAQPFARELLRDKLTLPRLRKQLVTGVRDLSTLLWDLPQRTARILSLVEGGRLKVYLENRDLKQHVRSLTASLDRLAASILISSMVLGSALLNLRHSKFVLAKIPLAELGLIICILLGTWLLINLRSSIRR
ncbi:MAG TPA: AarF/ABC1/UbiB kinase family protein [Bacillota bacterium]|nr:AarF/ABC1/UbiB kinase family protein [Bacillota bacterium]